MFIMNCKQVILRSLIKIKNVKVRSFLLEFFGYSTQDISTTTKRYLSQKFDAVTSEMLATLDLSLFKFIELLKLSKDQDKNILNLKECLMDLRCLSFRSFQDLETKYNSLKSQDNVSFDDVIKDVRGNMTPNPNKIIRSAYKTMLGIKVENP